MTATIEPTITKERVTSATVRLRLAPTGSVPGLLDGAWWPRSRDLLREIPTLTNALDACRGLITHVPVNPAHWPVPPETERAAAARLIAAATVPGGIRTASGLMADEAISHDSAETRSREEEWETDGGAATEIPSSALRR